MTTPSAIKIADDNAYGDDLSTERERMTSNLYLRSNLSTDRTRDEEALRNLRRTEGLVRAEQQKTRISNPGNSGSPFFGEAAVSRSPVIHGGSPVQETTTTNKGSDRTKKGKPTIEDIISNRAVPSIKQKAGHSKSNSTSESINQAAKKRRRHRKKKTFKVSLLNPITSQEHFLAEKRIEGSLHHKTASSATTLRHNEISPSQKQIPSTLDADDSKSRNFPTEESTQSNQNKMLNYRETDTIFLMNGKKVSLGHKEASKRSGIVTARYDSQMQSTRNHDKQVYHLKPKMGSHMSTGKLPNHKSLPELLLETGSDSVYCLRTVETDQLKSKSLVGSVLGNPSVSHATGTISGTNRSVNSQIIKNHIQKPDFYAQSRVRSQEHFHRQITNDYDEDTRHPMAAKWIDEDHRRATAAAAAAATATNRGYVGGRFSQQRHYRATGTDTLRSDLLTSPLDGSSGRREPTTFPKIIPSRMFNFGGLPHISKDNFESMDLTRLLNEQVDEKRPFRYFGKNSKQRMNNQVL